MSRFAMRTAALAIIALALGVGLLVWLGAPGGSPETSPGATGPATPHAGTATPASTAPPGTGAEASAAATGDQGSSTPAGGPSDAPVAVLVGAGDIADCASDGDEATARLLDEIDGTVFTLGDNVYEAGTLDEFERCYTPSWGRLSIRGRTRPTPGNHEYRTPGAAGYFGYFGPAAGDPSTGYYAYDHGTWRVYVLNSNCEAVGGCGNGSAQEQWLRQDLAAHPRACVAAMWHEPRFSSGPHRSNAMTEALWAALYDAGAELVMSGHDHHYERFAPQTATGTHDDARGIVQFIVGTGGRSRRSVDAPVPNSVVSNDDTWGVLRLSLSTGSWSAEFVPVAGATFSDSASGSCH